MAKKRVRIARPKSVIGDRFRGKWHNGTCTIVDIEPGVEGNGIYVFKMGEDEHRSTRSQFERDWVKLS